MEFTLVVMPSHSDRGVGNKCFSQPSRCKVLVT